jgi:copper chaperone CopZ
MQTYYLTVSEVISSKRMSKVAGVLSALPGVGAVAVSPMDGELTIHFNETHVSAGELTSALEEAGYLVDCAGLTHRGGARNSRIFSREPLVRTPRRA